MKICLVSQEYPPETGWGGIGTQAYIKAHGLAARGHNIHVISASRDSRFHNYRDKEVSIQRIPALDLSAPAYEESTYWLAYGTSVAKILKSLSKELTFDVIQFAEYGAEGFIFQTDTFHYRKSKYVVQMHGPLAMFTEHMGWPDPASTFSKIGCFMEEMVIKYSDCLTSSSHNTAKFCSRFYGTPMENIYVVHSGINTSIFTPRTQPEDEHYPRVLFVGKIVENKGIVPLVNSIIQLRKDFPKIVLRAIGRGNQDLLKDIKELIDREGVESNFEFLGQVPYIDLPKHYAWCDFFAGPSFFEPGPGNVYLEAMSSGKPVIACNSGGAPEVVINEETGLLVPANDSKALAISIAKLTEEVDLRHRLGCKAREWVLENFSLEHYINKIEEIYRRALS